MSDDEYRDIIEKLIESGRAFDAMYELQGYVKNFIDNMNVMIREVKAERNAVIKICDSKESNKHKIDAIRALIKG